MPESRPTIQQLSRQPHLAFPESCWETTAPSDRVTELRQALVCEHREIDVERAILATESYSDSEGQPMVLRRARMLLHIARNITLAVDPLERIAGNRSSLPRMGVVAPEGAVTWIDKELETFDTRPQDTFQISEEHIRVLRSRVFPYWRDRALEDAVGAEIPPDVLQAVQARVFALNQTDHAQGHILPDVTSWLTEGVDGLKQRVARERLRAGRAPEQLVFYDALETALCAAHDFAARHAAALRCQADIGCDPSQALELRDLAQICDRLSCFPPSTFHEALQSLWFLMVLLQIESNASSFSPGRLDQYLMPFLGNDLESGRLDLVQAQDLLEHLWLKFNQIVLLRSAKSAQYFAGFPIGFNIVLSGQHPDGRDATNALSYMCLRAQADIRLPQPNLSVRIHDKTPDDFLRATAQLISQGGGMPQVFCDPVIVKGQINRGMDRYDAMNYAVVGCVELSTPGKALGWSDAAMFNMVRVLELTLFGGRDPTTDRQIGLQTQALDSMTSYADLESAYAVQLDHFVSLMIRGCDIVDRTHQRLLPSPMLSLVVQDCIDKGVDVTAGGAHYNMSGVQGVQVANVADSLTAIRQAVFTEHWISASQLLECLRSDFETSEGIRQRLLRQAPKYGNDCATVDLIAAKWARYYCDLVSKYTNQRGGPYQPGFYTVSAHVPMGKHVGATPDGRHAAEPLADGGVSPSSGRDHHGPTAVLRSVSTLPLDLASNGALLNLKFLPSLFRSAEGIDSFVSLLRTTCSLGIPHVQFNVVSNATLRQAKAHPEQYGDLVIRVAGYSAYFTQLDEDLQREIIERTEHACMY